MCVWVCVCGCGGGDCFGIDINGLAFDQGEVAVEFRAGVGGGGTE